MRSIGASTVPASCISLPWTKAMYSFSTVPAFICSEICWWTYGFLAMARTPEVSRSRRCTGRKRMRKPRCCHIWTTPLARVPDQCPVVGCTMIPAGLLTISR
ncbi:hypothetical protein D3C76_1162390 [compost metagenome]